MKETIRHVLQGCPLTHWPRIQRHTEIAKKIRDYCKQKKWTVEYEPLVRHPDGTLFKPDLIIHRENTTSIVDAQVCWEADLTTAHERKRAVDNNDKFMRSDINIPLKT